VKHQPIRAGRRAFDELVDERVDADIALARLLDFQPAERVAEVMSINFCKKGRRALTF
jgi:hypothetical protein